jgi:hypothetical protein
VVSHIIVGQGSSNRDSSGEETIGEESTSVFAGTPTTIATIDFEDQVNPTRMFRHSRAVSDGQSFDTFKNVMDGVGVKAMPRATARPPTLAPIPYVPALQLDDYKDSASNRPVTPTAEKPILPLVREARPTVNFADVAHLKTLAIGSGVPLSEPRTTVARPHTTGELIPGVNFIPYLPFHPRFNPYDRASTPTPAPDSPKKPSADDLAAAFAKAEVAEQVIAHKRHTTLYEEVEGGLLLPPIAVAAPAPVHQIKRKAVPTASASASTPDAVSSQPATSKPLPPVPSPGSPRRYTRGFVPPALAMNDNGYPILEKPSRREQQQKAAEKAKKEKKKKEEKSVKRTQSQKVRAVERALRKLF